MKFQILNNEELGFFDNNGNKKAIMKLSGSNFIIDPVDTGANIIMGEGETVNDLELGIVSTPINMTFLGGGTITSNGNTLYIGDANNNDSIVLYNTTFSSSVTMAAGLSGSFSGSHYGTFTGYGGNLTGIVATVAPGGDNKTIQFNDGNTDTGGNNNFTFDKTTNAVSITGSLNISGSLNGNISGSITADSFIGNGSGLTGVTSTFSPVGEIGSIQFKKTSTEVSGSGDILYDFTNNSLILTGELSSSTITSPGANLTGSFTGSFIGSVTDPNLSTGSFTGSFIGDGSQLTGISGVFPFTGSANITGSLDVVGNISGSQDLNLGDRFVYNNENDRLVISNRNGLIVGADSGMHSNGFSGSFEIFKGPETYLQGVRIGPAGNPGGFGPNSSMILANDGYRGYIGTGNYSPLIFAHLTRTGDPTIIGSQHGGVSSTGFWGFGSENWSTRMTSNTMESRFWVRTFDAYINPSTSIRLNPGSSYSTEVTGSMKIQSADGLVIGSSNANANGVKGVFEFLTGEVGTYDSTLLIRKNGNPGGFGVNNGLYLRANDGGGEPDNSSIGTSTYDSFFFKTGMSPTGLGTVRGGYTSTGNWSFGKTPSNAQTHGFEVNHSAKFDNNVNIQGTLSLPGITNVSASIASGGTGGSFPYTGSATISGSLIIDGGPANASIFEINGSSGQLFSITDSLSGSLFAVSDVSGLPILEVFSDDTIKMGSFNAEALEISGSDVNFNNLPTVDPGVAGRLYQTGSDAIGATAGFQVVCISQG